MISLDLVIRNTIGKQLEAIKASIKQPVEDMRQQISKGVQDTVQSVADGAKAAMQQSMDEVKKTTEQTTDYIDDLIDKALAPKVAAPKVEPIEMPEVKPSKKTTVSVGYDPEAMSFMEEYGEKLKAKAGEISDEMREKLGNFEISADPTERIEQQMDNLRNKIALTQKQWQELMYAWNNADPGSKAFDNLDGKLNSTEKQLLSLQSQYEKLGEAAKASVAKMADETKAKVSELTDEMREKLGNFEISKDPTERIQQQMSVLTDKISVTQKRWQELAYALENTDPGSKDFDKLTASLSNAENRLISLQSQYEKLQDKANKPAESVKSVAAKAGASIKNALSGAFNHVKKVGAKALSGLRSGFSRVGKSVKGLFKPIANLGKKIKQTFKRVFLFAGILAAVKALKSGIGDVMNQNEAFQKSLNDVKANLAIAFTPIINTVMPILTKLMQGVATVSKYVAGFIASLFGQTYQQAAQATKKLKGTSAEAKKAKQSLAGIDEINTLSSGKDDESSSDSGGIDYSSLDMSEPEYPDWAKSLKDSILSGDWAGVGKTLGEKVTSVLTGIPWTDLGRKFSESVNSIFSGINSFFKNTDWGGIVKDMTEGLNAAVSGTDWALIGDTLASGLSAIIDSAYAFVTTFDFSGFGSGLGDSVNAFFAGIDWSKAAETLSGAITGLLDSLIGFLETVDWQAIGEDIYTFISSIDWSGIISRLFQALGSLLGAAGSLLWGAIRTVVANVKSYFSKKIEEAGGSIIGGLWKGIKDAFGDAWKWIKENIFQPFLDGFKKCFGIHSPSTVMAEMGDYIIQGLYNAVSGGIEKVKKIFIKILNTIKDVFTGIGGWFKQTFTEVFTNVKAVLQSIISFITSVFAGNWSRAWNSIKKAFQSVWDGMVTVVKIPINLIISAINKMTGAVESAVNSIIDGLNTLSFDIPDWVPKIGGSHFGFDLGHIDIPEIPKLASGGLATAPTLAMVGDNRNASVDPEVIAPLSKLSSMLGSADPAVLALLGEILEAIKEKRTVVSIDSNAIGRASAAYTHGKTVRV
nr:MAG TPA: minor tail protein [Caudoviricetes sp.]